MKQFLTTSRLFAKLGAFAAAIFFVLIAVGLFTRSAKTVAAETTQQFQLARWNPESQIFAAQRGNPWINLQDGKEILTDLAGSSELRANFQNMKSRPLSIATADFDEDGTPDIVVGYADDKRGAAAAFMRGNVDAVYPNSEEAKERKSKGEFTEAPFLSPARLFDLSVAPDFLAAGDFDADGHFDIAAAARNENAVYFLKGDGRGDFILAKRIELSGKVTAVLADDFNRRDGVHDLIVAVQNEKGAQVLIFEHPYGAMKAQPEIFTFAAPVKSLATGLLEGDAHFDLAIAAGNELAVLRGRDRKLLLDESGKQSDAPQLTRQKFDFEIDALAVGDFIKGKIFSTEIALLAADGKIHLLENGGTTNAKGNFSAAWREKESVSLPNNLSNDNAPVMLTTRVSSRPVDTLIIGAGEQIHLLTSDVTPSKTANEAINYNAQKFNLAASLDVASKAVAILPMRLNVDALSDLVVMREDSVTPSIVQTAPMATFTVVSTANDSDSDLTDRFCATMNGVCTYLAAREQANFNGDATTINFNVPGSGTPVFIGPQPGIISPLTIDGTTQSGGFVEFKGMSNQFPATLRTGINTDNCVFRGIVANDYNGNNYYFNLPSSNHIVEGNHIGTNVAGTATVTDEGGSNNYGVNIDGGNNLIGGTTPAARNIISTGNGEGVNVAGNASNKNPNRVQGNYIGTDITGTVPLGNINAGVTLQSPNILVGGTAAGAGNVISATTGNANFGASGIDLRIGSGIGMGVLIQGNRIGTNAAGTAALSNLGQGIIGRTGSPFDTIGGTTPAARNIISGNRLNGLDISTTGAGNVTQQIIGNFIGTNATGSAAIPNGGFGLQINGSITKLVSNNVISGNTGGGLQFCCNLANTGEVISNNLIGTDATGLNPLGNGGVGLFISSGDTGGATQSGSITGNTIAANGSHGILADNIYNLIFQNNFIGTNSSLSAMLGNGGDGMRFINQFRFNEIGGEGNTIAYNAGNGINFATTNIGSDQNRIGSNSIFSNGGLGIDLGGNGVTPNDDCDGENGVNNLQNFPVISAVSATGNNVRIVGRLNSAPNLTYVLNFYANRMADASGFGEGERFIGTTSVPVPAGCQANFSLTLPQTLASARCISATATDPDGNTSEFSSCVPIRTPTADYNNDGLADLTVWRPSDGNWYTRPSSTGGMGGMDITVHFGQNGDRPAPGDFNGDGQMDFAVFRPSDTVWYRQLNPGGGLAPVRFGLNTDLPIPGDYDGDGVDDIMLWRDSDTNWYLLPSSGSYSAKQFGLSGDRPVSGDFDGDGKNDLAVFRPSNGDWWILNSRDSSSTSIHFGFDTDTPVPADYDGDGKTDIAVYRPSNGTWYYLRSGSGNSFAAVQWGNITDTPVPADYDGDGAADIAIYRSGEWWILQSSDGIVQFKQFGQAGDIPIPAAKQF